eukprot:1920952-Alexandrium_andersonii.AAC.1
MRSRSSGSPILISDRPVLDSCDGVCTWLGPARLRHGRESGGLSSVSSRIRRCSVGWLLTNMTKQVQERFRVEPLVGK